SSPHREASSQSAPLNDAFVVSLTSNLLAYLGSETLITAGPIQQWQTTVISQLLLKLTIGLSWLHTGFNSSLNRGLKYDAHLQLFLRIHVPKASSRKSRQPLSFVNSI
ncbi:MAG: hypothetical protein NXI04_12195, partial [Planctomycetaceae bacterium]|nr:hypothetical protein [Planctomycetaceae bacterium]